MALRIAPPPKGMKPLDLSGAPTSLTRKEVDQRHPDWSASQELWFNVSVLYEGGNLIKQNAERFLKRRPKEDNTVYQHRQDQFNYENNLGTGFGWHEAEMFETDPTIDIKVAGLDGNATDAKLNPEQEAFYNAFMKDCDKHGTTFIDLYRTVFTHLLLFRYTFVGVDLPKRDPDQPVASLQDEKTLGLLNPYLYMCSPLDVINWEADEYGNLNWLVIYQKAQKNRFGQKPVTVERWYYYDRQTYRIYEAKTQAADGGTLTSDAATLDQTPVEMVDAGYHPLAAQNTVPLQRVEMPAGWWLGNRVYLPAMEHVNVSNALKWSLFMAALAVPVLCTSRDVSSISQSETGFILLDPQDSYTFAEPTGTSWSHLAERANTLKEEIWRGMYLVAQSRKTSATAASASGVSKQQDMAPSHDFLNGVGDKLRAAMQLTLERVEQVRAGATQQPATLRFDVRGFTFEEKLDVEEISVLTDLLALNVPSDTFDKELYGLAVRAALKDANPDRLKTIFDEIEAAPSRAEMAQQEQQQQLDMIRTKMEATMGSESEGGGAA